MMKRKRKGIGKMKIKVKITAYWTEIVEANSIEEAEQIASKQVKLKEADWIAKSEVVTDENE